MTRLFAVLPTVVSRIIPADWKVFISGMEILTPANEYNGILPKIICAGRTGLETLLRRMVIGRKMYAGIEQIHGTVVGYEKDPENSQYLSKVLVRQGSDNKISAIPATLIVGAFRSLFSPSALDSSNRLHWPCERWRQDDSAFGFWNTR